ncbi:MAG: glycosyltransferase family 2 protein [Chloroflexi bacterium]|nr:glycosyltransferase family 2 protein [Chloroflexota bacterium]
MKLSVVIPAHNGERQLRRCLKTLATHTRQPDEIIVVDDASSDGSANLAREMGARVLSLPDGPSGPAFARNRGAEAASGDLVVFLDADVAVHPDTLALVEKYMMEHDEVAALFGSYDDAPRYRSTVSAYKNLLHHFVHQHGQREASTFWAGCGAIRRDVFLALGGFNESYARPSIEDIELGIRLRRAGYRVWLCPDVQVKHLKHWRLDSLLRSDIFERAIPWTRLIFASARLPSDLNLDAKSRLSALAAWALVVCPALGLVVPWAALGAFVALGMLGALNGELYVFFAQRGGRKLALGAFGLHTLYLLYSSLVFVGLLTWHLLQKTTGEIKHVRSAR